MNNGKHEIPPWIFSKTNLSLSIYDFHEKDIEILDSLFALFLPNFCTLLMCKKGSGS